MQRVIAVSAKPASKAALNRKAISFHSLKRCISAHRGSIRKVNAVPVCRAFFTMTIECRKTEKRFEKPILSVFVNLSDIHCVRDPSNVVIEDAGKWTLPKEDTSIWKDWSSWITGKFENVDNPTENKVNVDDGSYTWVIIVVAAVAAVAVVAGGFVICMIIRKRRRSKV